MIQRHVVEGVVTGYALEGDGRGNTRAAVTFQSFDFDSETTVPFAPGLRARPGDRVTLTVEIDAQ